MHDSLELAGHDVLANGGEMGALMRAHDWAGTPVGKPADWTQALRTTVRLLLTSRHPMFIFWGEAHTCFYNDAYRSTMGPERHPGALGQPGRQVWDEIWPIISPQIDQVMGGGEATWHEDQLVPVTRHGRREDVWWTYGYSPIDDPAAPGGVGGVLVVCNDVTREHLTREALREAEERMRLALAAADGVGTWDWDVAIDHVRADARFATLYGVDPARAAAGAPLAEFTRSVHPDDAHRVGNAIIEALRTGGEFAAEYRLTQADGSVRWVSARGRCMQAPDGTPLRFPGVTVDITERKQAEATLHESQGRLGVALDIAELGTFEWDRPTNRVTLDARSRAIFGFSPDEGTHAKEVFSRIEPADFDRVLAEVQASMRDMSRLKTEYRIRLPDGESRTVVSISDVLLNADGKPDRLLGVFGDVTERKRIEADLHRLNEMLELRVQERTAERNLLDKIVQATDVMIMASDLDYNILAINRANADEFERIYGVRPKAGDNMLALLAGQPEHQAQVRATWGRGLAGEEVTIVEDFGDPSRIRPYYEIKFRVLRDDLGERVGCYQFVTDVTERLREQAELADAQDKLRQSQKMEAVGQLTGGLAHDFNNLLAGISGSLELMQARVAQGRIGDLDRYLVAAQGAAKRAAALTHRLLAFTRRQTLDPKPTDVNRLVTGMDELVRRTVGPGVTVEVVGAAGLWTVLADPNQLENALLNLCINARDAMPDGGRLTIETGNRWLDERTARQRGLIPGQYVSLCVSDTGSGMTPEVARRAFDPFFTTKPIGMGTGLGLSMIYGFVQQSGGQARIYSEPDQGTMVCLYLPRHHGEAEAMDGPGEPMAAPRAEAGETVLVVDDEPTVRMLVTEILEDLGYMAIEAADGAAGLQVLRSNARIDLLVTDVGLPGGMNGRQVADAARVTRPSLKVLFITGYAENAVLSHGHLEPGMHVLTKPFAIEALANRIKELIAGP